MGARMGFPGSRSSGSCPSFTTGTPPTRTNWIPSEVTATVSRSPRKTVQNYFPSAGLNPSRPGMAGATHETARGCAGVLTVLQDRGSVHEDVMNSG